MTFDADRLNDIAAAAFQSDPTNPLHETSALAATLNGELVFECYGGAFDETSTFLSWSMAKSVTSALCGVLVGEGLLVLDDPAPVPEWHVDANDPRSAITLRHLLQMRSGLRWNEDYVDGESSDVIEMLFASGSNDTAGYAVACPAEHAPGAEWLYASGTTNIIARILSEAVGGGAARFREALIDGLLVPAGMQNTTIRFDEAGTFIGSSFLYATAQDYLAFGELFRNDGVANGQRLLPEGWVDASITDHATCPETGQGYGLQWWITRDEHHSFSANGYEGQRLQVSQDLGLTFVRLGKTSAEFGPELRAFYADVANCFV